MVVLGPLNLITIFDLLIDLDLVQNLENSCDCDLGSIRDDCIADDLDYIDACVNAEVGLN